MSQESRCHTFHCPPGALAEGSLYADPRGTYLDISANHGIIKVV